MKKILIILSYLYLNPLVANEIPLIEQMKSLDTEVFQAFNNCLNEQELAKHASYFSEDVEFYHDNGGVTWDRDTMIASTKKHACGNFTRQLISETFKAYPIKNFGAITEGVHLFCQINTSKCEGKANFVMVWRNINSQWIITRVLSYGHEENN